MFFFFVFFWEVVRGRIGESEGKREGWGWRVGLRLSKEGKNKKKNKNRMAKKELMREGGRAEDQ